MVSIVAVAVGGVGLLFAWKSAIAADQSAKAAAGSAQASHQSAMTAKVALQIERRHDEMRPLLQGRIVPGQNYGAGRDHCPEVRPMALMPLIWITVVVATDAAVESGMDLTSFNLFSQGDIRTPGPVHASSSAA